MSKADIDFEKELWDAANELRGAVSENNYKNYILPLVFLKHLSERFEIVQEKLLDELNEPSSKYYTIDSEEKDSEEESESKYTQKSSDLVARKTPFGAIIFNSLNKTHTSPALETFSPPPDWL